MNFRFNCKHILFHFLGLWFFSHAFMVFAYLENVEVAEIVRCSTDISQIKTALSLSKLVVSMGISFVLGYLIALLISFIVSNKIKGTWINTLFAFIIFFLLMKLNLTGWDTVKGILLYPGSFFSGRAYYLTNGVILTALGLFFIVGVKFFYGDTEIRKTSETTEFA